MTQISNVSGGNGSLRKPAQDKTQKAIEWSKISYEYGMGSASLKARTEAAVIRGEIIRGGLERGVDIPPNQIQILKDNLIALQNEFKELQIKRGVPENKVIQIPNEKFRKLYDHFVTHGSAEAGEY